MYDSKIDEQLVVLWAKLSETLDLSAQISDINSRNSMTSIYELIKDMRKLLTELRKYYTALSNITDSAYILFGEVERILLETFKNDPYSLYAQEVYRDLGPRVSYAHNYPAMVLYTMFCEKKTNLYSIMVSPDYVANLLSLGASVANAKGLSREQWHGYILNESDSEEVRKVFYNLPLNNQKLEWLGHSTESKIEALKASGLLDNLEPDTTELVLGLVEGWETGTKDLIATAKILSK